jgi:hypothetical protein
LKGTVVSLPHCEQLVRVSTRGVWFGAEATCPYDDERLDLQLLQRRGSFLNCLSWKNNCSPAVKMNSELQSMHFNTLSWNSMRRCSLSSPVPGRLLAGKNLSAIRRAKTRKNLGHIPLNWLVELQPGFGPPSPTKAKATSTDDSEEVTRATTGEWGGPYFLLTNPALYELFSGYVSVPVLL